ncbi:transporter substrate-binding domain-containing protein [Bdellovibrio sp. HCB185ZH]|uniref:transporter substrate-binding domain-containing protein n=1 Tax=Bdellovibrio sp. HCB185ZH TaxID=3394235 RepID=UPI0039A6F109
MLKTCGVVLVVILSQASLSRAISKCERTFRVGVIENEPLYYLEQNEARGSMLDTIAELRKRTGCGFEVLEMSRPTLVERMKNASVDITVLSIKTPTMDKVGRFIQMFRSYRAVTFAPDLQKKNYDLQQALADKAVVFGSFIGTQGYFKEEEISLLREQGRIRQFPDYATVFQALKRRQLKVFIGSVSISDYFLQKYKMTDFGMQIDRKVITGVGSYYAPKRVSAQEVKMLEAALASMVRDGTFAKIYGKYSSALVLQNAIVPND